MQTEQTPPYVEAVANILRQHRGKKNAITVKRIADKIGKSYDHATCPGTRQLIFYLMKNQKMPIGSCANGYFLITTDDELEEYTATLYGRAEGIMDRIAAVQIAHANAGRGVTA